MNYTTQEIMAHVVATRTGSTHENTVKARELTSRENPEKPWGAREVYKDKNIKINKDISRAEHLSEETERILPSAPIGQTSSETASPEGLGESHKAQGLVVDPAQTSSRAYTGIAAYHVKTARGVKIKLTVQTAQDSHMGAVVELTAELKHRKRFREIKSYEGDNPQFQQFVESAREHYRQESDDYWMGRVHRSGTRSAWFADVLVIAYGTQKHIDWLQIWFDEDNYTVIMNHELSANQAQWYHTGGRHGNLVRRRQVPSMATAERTLFT